MPMRSAGRRALRVEALLVVALFLLLFYYWFSLAGRYAIFLYGHTTTNGCPRRRRRSSASAAPPASSAYHSSPYLITLRPVAGHEAVLACRWPTGDNRIMIQPDQTQPWDIVDHLQTEADMIAYLDAAFEDGDPALIVAALGDIARAMG